LNDEFGLSELVEHGEGKNIPFGAEWYLAGEPVISVKRPHDGTIREKLVILWLKLLEIFI